MSDAFNQYRKWLGVPPAEQPPHHYRLLGIGLYEDDPDVIESAADQRMAHLRTLQARPHSALSQKLLNDLPEGVPSRLLRSKGKFQALPIVEQVDVDYGKNP